jgi:hypothetical protein
VKSVDELQDMVQTLVVWDKVETIGLDNGKKMEMEQQIQVEHVILLERAVEAALEGKIEEVRNAAPRFE